MPVCYLYLIVGACLLHAQVHTYLLYLLAYLSEYLPIVPTYLSTLHYPNLSCTTLPVSGLSLPMVACCFKQRNAKGLQKRWSVLSAGGDDGPYTTQPAPVYHYPKDECGGGSAWR